jgi:hypothetical protein
MVGAATPVGNAEGSGRSVAFASGLPVGVAHGSSAHAGVAAAFSTRPALDHMPPIQRQTHRDDFRFLKARGRDLAGLPVWNGYGYLPDVASSQSEYIAPADSGAAFERTEPYAEPYGQPRARVPDCRTDSQRVPSEKGGRVTVNVTRCY